MENSVEIMCIDIRLNSSNIKRMGEKRRVIVIMYSIKLLTPAPEWLVFVGSHLQSRPSRGSSSKISDK